MSSKTKAATSSKRRLYNPVLAMRSLPSGTSLSEVLRRANALLASSSGLDKVFMVVQYSSPLLAWALIKSTKVHPLSLKSRRPAVAAAVVALASKISDARMLFRFAGLLPILAWLRSLYSTGTRQVPATTAEERSSRRLRAIEKVQAWSMVAYYPLEHAYYLAAHGMIAMDPSTRLKLILWACRAWGVYVFLQLWHYSEEARTLSARMALISEKRKQLQVEHHDSSVANQTPGDQEKVDTDTIVAEAGNAVNEAALVMSEQDCLKQGTTLVNGVMTNLAYAPLTIHWSLEKGIFSSEIWSAVFGTMAAVSGLRASWRATA